ncbi:amidase family protein [Thermoactinospora rubra]|uniref:amidase family protein n=1 Tax=Thermoactinospora rubra TaxID=1088767 RepID=UPI00197D7075|nr:amidase family protein [Thermoactinospora rubra]
MPTCRPYPGDAIGERPAAGNLDAVAIGERLAAGDLDAAELCAQALRLARRPEAVAVFTALTAGRAEREAGSARTRLAAGRPLSPLDGVPVAVKDLFDVAGTVTTAGSRLLASGPPAGRDASVVRRLAAAGMVCVGKTNLSEFAFSGLGVNPHFGTPANPGGGEPLIPGGSSSGSAVAVALGVVPVAIGTDTSGSVRVPAAFCGVVGYKASEGRYGSRGMLPLAPTLDSVGVLAAAVRDIVATDAVLLDAPPQAPADRPPRLVVPAGELLDDCTPAVRRRFEDCLARLSSEGLRVETRDVPVLARAQALLDEHATIVEAEAFQRYGRLLDSGERAQVDPGVLRRPARFAVRGRYDEVNRWTLRTTMLLSYLGMPGVTLPVGTPESGRAGFLVSAPAGRDRDLLAAAGHIEGVLLGTRPG